MIVYFVRFQTFDAPMHVCTDNQDKPAETWSEAKARRNQVFADPQMRRCWIERIDQRMDGDLVVELSKERWGEVLARREPGEVLWHPPAPSSLPTP